MGVINYYWLFLERQNCVTCGRWKWSRWHRSAAFKSDVSFGSLKSDWYGKSFFRRTFYRQTGWSAVIKNLKLSKIVKILPRHSGTGIEERLTGTSKISNVWYSGTMGTLGGIFDATEIQWKISVGYQKSLDQHGSAFFIRLLVEGRFINFTIMYSYSSNIWGANRNITAPKTGIRYLRRTPHSNKGTFSLVEIQKNLKFSK